MSRAAADMPRAATATDQPTLLSAGTITGGEVCNLKDEKLGSIQDLMLDIHSGRILYVVLSSGGFLGLGGRLVAIPWRTFRPDGPNRRFTIDVEVERPKSAPGFDKDEWPRWSDTTWSASVNSYDRATRPGSTPGR